MAKRKVKTTEKHGDAKTEIQIMLEEVRLAVSRCRAPEKEVYEQLMEEAGGWEMRLTEIEEEEATDGGHQED